ncbi:MAG: YkgJ family cysteine cluster protein [Syntrophomonadaceae bacterium]|jgi:hypothetical protein|nr:YkgJ family cysteine cluster protein [Syntrophomonadaceae bacterium]
MMEIKYLTIEGRPSYDIKIRNDHATIQNLLDHLNQFIEEGLIQRLWSPGRSNCYGCDLCCHEWVPLTSIDVKQLMDIKGIGLIEAYKYLWVEAQEQVLDITLRRKGDGSCIFLQSNGTCAIYNKRPFVCQTYICCPTTARAEELRSQVVNKGMDDLIRISLKAFASRGQNLPINRRRSVRIRPEDWGKNGFSGKEDYSQVMMKKVLSSDLFKQMVL